MKTFLSVVMTLIVVSSLNLALAQPGGGKGGPNMDPAEMANRQTERMTTALDLNEEQTASIQEINLTYANIMKEARANRTGDRDEMRATMEVIQADRNAEIKTVLTETQYATFMEQQAEQRQKRGERGRGEGRKRKEKPAN